MWHFGIIKIGERTLLILEENNMALHNDFIDQWYKWHELERGDTPTKFSKADAKSIKEIRERLKLAIERKRGAATDQDTLDLFIFVLNRLKESQDKTMQFLYKQNLPMINSRLDNILAIIKDERNKPAGESLAAEQKRKFRESILNR